MIKPTFRYLSDAVREPREELTRRQRQLRLGWEFSAHCWRVLRRHRAEGMAAELTYRTIFALIPLFVLGLVMFRVVGGLDEVRSKVETQLYAFFGVPDVAYWEGGRDPFADTDGGGSEDSSGAGSETTLPPSATPEAGRPEADRPADAPPPSEELLTESDRQAAENAQTQASIRMILSTAIGKVAEIDFRSIGIIGFLLFLYAAIALADSVEEVFNNVFEASMARPLHLRLAIHWSIITLGSGLLAMSLYLSSQLVEYVAETSLGGGLQIYLNHLLAVLASWVLLFLLYALMPNASVSVRAAAIGGLVAALLWEAAKYGFQVYVQTALPYSALYGSLGLIPLFLFWVYITWWIVLFGLVWTYSLQNFRGRIPTRAEDEAALMTGDPAWMLPIMVEVARAYEAGERLTLAKLVERLGLPDRAVHQMCEALTDCDWLLGVEQDGKTTLIPTRPAAKMNVAELLNLPYYGRSQITHGPAWQYLDRLRGEEIRRARQQTVADLMADAAPAAEPASGAAASGEPASEQATSGKNDPDAEQQA